MKRVKQKAKDIIASRHVVKGMFVASMLESTVVPVPIETVLLPVMQARRDKLWLLAFAATAGCLVGSLFGYALGFFLFEIAEQLVVGSLTTQAQLDDVIQQMQAQGFFFVLTLGIVPIPLQIAMIAAGATGFSLWLYLAAVTISRVIRYYGIAIVVYYAGNHAEKLIREYKYSVTAGLVLLIVLLWWLTN